MKILGVDCDLTVCPSDKGWDDYLSARSHKVPIKDCEPLPYNLGKLYPEVEDPYIYWRELDYSQFQPIEGSVQVLKALSRYFDIVFISSVKGNHNKSKYYWLKKHFPFMTGYLATKEKYLMNDSVAAMADDRLDILQNFDLEKRVLYKTHYSQSVKCDVGYTIESWKTLDVEDFISYLLRGENAKRCTTP